MIDKPHWYDGIIYDKIIAPNQERLFLQIESLLDTHAKVMDVGCGTGFFSFSAANSCQTILGIDLSSKNIRQANRNLALSEINNLSFRHASVRDLIQEQNLHFDYAVMTFVIHEVNENERIGLLNDIFELTDKLIIADYLIPQRTDFWKNSTNFIEFVAGREHFRNFKSYEALGGLHYLVQQAGLTIEKEIKNRYNQIVVLKKN
jgi:cyclopropane fatty-acyl-phospholipid synthase-like methyltransferase